MKNPSFSLSYLPLCIRLKCCEMVNLPVYLGSTLHGILGWALLPYTETYHYIFENRKLGGQKQDIINPYLIDPPRYQSMYYPGEELCFQVILLGDALSHFKRFIEAMIHAKQFGIGAERKPFELVEILQDKQLRSIWKQNYFDEDAITLERMVADRKEQATHCTLHLLTPLRIRRGGELLLELDFTTIIRSITRRIKEMITRYGGEVDLEEIEELITLSSQIKTGISGLYKNQINRYSNRRSQAMDLSGLLGVMAFEGEISPFTPWLNAARIFHIGRNVTLGCGKIDVCYW